MEVNHHNLHETAKRDGAISSTRDKLPDVENEDAQTKHNSQTKEGSAAYKSGENETKDSRETVRGTENYSTVDRDGTDIGEGARHDDEEDINRSSRRWHLDFIVGAVLGSIIGPFSLLVLTCWHGMSGKDDRRANFLLGCSVGIIFQIVGFSIAFSVYKLSSRQGR